MSLKSSTYTFDWTCSTLEDSLQVTVCDTLLVSMITYTSNSNALGGEEFSALVGFTAPLQINDVLIKRALSRIYASKKYTAVRITLTLCDDGTHALHWHLEAAWLLAKLSFAGNFLYRDRYKAWYIGEAGESFNATKHTASLRAIEQRLHEEGYWHARIEDTLCYNDTDKTVRGVVNIDRGTCCSIKEIELTMQKDDKRSDAEIRRLMHNLQEAYTPFKGAYCTQEVIDNLEQALLDVCVYHGFFQAHNVFDYKVHDGAVTVICSLTLHTKRTFEFFGNHAFSKTLLLESLLTFGKALLYLPPSILADELQIWYNNQGFLESTITWQEEPERCFFCITEGEQATLNKISVEGIGYFSHDKIYALLSRCLLKKTVNKKLMLRSLHALQTLYTKAGFWDCFFEEAPYIKLPDNGYECKLTVREGRQRFLKEVRLDDFLQHATIACEPCGHLKKPIPFDREIIHEQRKFLVKQLQEHGYTMCNPKPELVEEEDGIILIWHSGNPQHTYFGSTIITGTTNMSYARLMRQLDYQEGDLWSQKKIHSSIQNLRALGIFESVTLTTLANIYDGKQDTLLRVTEDDPFELRVRGGVQSIGRNSNFQDLTYRAGGSFFWKSPLRRADRFTFDADVTKYARTVVGCYHLPWLGDHPISADYKIYSIRFDEPVSTYVSERLYQLGQDGCAASFLRKQENQQIGVACGIEWMEVSKLSERHARAIDFSPRLVDQKIPYFFIEPTYLVSRLDDPVSPSLGFITLVSGKAMVTTSAAQGNYCKIMAEQSLFVPCAPTAVLAFRLRLGHIFNDCFAHIMPSERFYLGGAYSLRSYETDLVPPYGVAEFCSIPALVPKGGKTMFNTTVELRFPLYAYLGAVLFSDCGALAQDTLRTIYPELLAGALGFGLRLATPVGPVRFDIGWKWHMTEWERHRYAWCLTLGQMF